MPETDRDISFKLLQYPNLNILALLFETLSKAD